MKTSNTRIETIENNKAVIAQINELESNITEIGTGNEILIGVLKMELKNLKSTLAYFQKKAIMRNEDSVSQNEDRATAITSLQLEITHAEQQLSTATQGKPVEAVTEQAQPIKENEIKELEMTIAYLKIKEVEAYRKTPTLKSNIFFNNQDVNDEDKIVITEQRNRIKTIELIESEITRLKQ